MKKFIKTIRENLEIIKTVICLSFVSISTVAMAQYPVPKEIQTMDGTKAVFYKTQFKTPESIGKKVKDDIKEYFGIEINSQEDINKAYLVFSNQGFYDNAMLLCEITSQKAFKTNYKECGIFNLQVGLAKVSNNGKFGYIDSTGKEVIPLIYEAASNYFYDDRVAFVVKNGKEGIINTQGKELTLFKYDEIYNFAENGVAKAKINNNYGYLNNIGKEITLFKYSKFSEGFIDGIAKVAVKKIENKKYSEQELSHGLDQKYGFIDSTGKEIVAPINDMVTNSGKGFGIGAVFMPDNKNYKVNNSVKLYDKSGK